MALCFIAGFQFEIPEKPASTAAPSPILSAAPTQEAAASTPQQAPVVLASGTGTPTVREHIFTLEMIIREVLTIVS